MDDFYDFLFEEPEEQKKPQAEQYYNNGYQYAAQPAKPVIKEKKKHGAARIVALALCCSLLGGAVGAGTVTLVNRQQQTPEAQEAVTANALISSRESAELDLVHVDNNKELTPAEVYAKNVNSTVGITTEIISTNLWGYQTTGAAAGSGFIITEDGYIVTNYHVVEGASSIQVAMYDGTEYDAELVGYDESNDVAVLKVEASGLTPVILGDSDEMNVGDTVLAIGNPLGELTFSLSSGVVSALNRDITLSGGIRMRLIQTTAPINSGNSGGALFNSYGEVVGITNAKYSSSGYSSEASIDNIGFAIPINSVLEIVSSIMEKGYYAHPYIGVSVGDVTEENQALGLPAGAAVSQVVSGSPAEQAGLKANDIITAANGQALTGSSDLVEAISDCEVGDTLLLTVYRQGETLTLTVTVGEKAQQTESEQTEQTPQTQQVDPFGGSGFGGFGGFPFGFGG